MNWVSAVSTGFGLGLAYYGGLWLGLQSVKRGQSPRGFALGRVARLALAAATFYALMATGGIIAVVTGLVGLLFARWYLVRMIGGQADGR